MAHRTRENKKWSSHLTGALKLPTQPLELLYFAFVALIPASHSQNATEGLGKQNEG